MSKLTLYLYEFKYSKGWCTLLSICPSQNAVELSVETAVPKTQQEATQQGYGHTTRENKVHHQLCNTALFRKKNVAQQII